MPHVVRSKSTLSAVEVRGGHIGEPRKLRPRTVYSRMSCWLQSETRRVMTPPHHRRALAFMSAPISRSSMQAFHPHCTTRFAPNGHGPIVAPALLPGSCRRRPPGGWACASCCRRCSPGEIERSSQPRSALSAPGIGAPFDEAADAIHLSAKHCTSHISKRPCKRQVHAAPSCRRRCAGQPRATPSLKIQGPR